MSIPSHGTLHLMEDGIMAAVHRISAVNIRTDEVAFAFICAKDVGLMGGSVGSENRRLVDVVGVCFRPSWMICRKA